MTDGEKQFFQAYGLGKPKIQVWTYDGYYEDWSWKCHMVDCSQTLAVKNWTIEDLDNYIQEYKQEYKNTALYDITHDAIASEYGNVTRALMKYPSITNRILLELICIAHLSPVITFTSTNIKDLKEEVLMVLSNWADNKRIKERIQELFKEE